MIYLCAVLAGIFSCAPSQGYQDVSGYFTTQIVYRHVAITTLNTCVAVNLANPARVLVYARGWGRVVLLASVYTVHVGICWCVVGSHLDLSRPFLRLFHENNTVHNLFFLSRMDHVSFINVLYNFHGDGRLFEVEKHEKRKVTRVTCPT